MALPPAPPASALRPVSVGHTLAKLAWPGNAELGIADGCVAVVSVREFPKPWDTATRVVLPVTAQRVALHHLTPTSTYELRYRLERAPAEDDTPGEPTTEWSSVVVMDTAAAGCVPEDEDAEESGAKKKSNCTVQ